MRGVWVGVLAVGVFAGSLTVPAGLAATVTDDFIKIYRLEPRRGAEYQVFLNLVCGRISVEVSGPGAGVAQVSHLGSVEVGVAWSAAGVERAVTAVYAESLIRRLLNEREIVCGAMRRAVDQVTGMLAGEGIRRGSSRALQAELNERLMEESSDPEVGKYFPRMRFVFPGAIAGSRFAGEQSLGLEVKRFGNVHFGPAFRVTKACDAPTPFEFIGDVHYPERVALAPNVSRSAVQAGDTPAQICSRVARALP